MATIKNKFRIIKAKKITVALLCIFLLPLLLSAQKTELINQGWKFFKGIVQNGERPLFNDKQWRTVDLPHDWSVEGTLSPTLASCTGYLPGGIGWYRKKIHIPEAEKGKKIYLYFEGVYNRSEVFINGNSLGKRPNGYISFRYDATPHIEYGKENIITVKVDHSQSADSRWYTGSGIYRNVWLIITNPVHISQWGVYAHGQNITAQKAELKTEVAIENESPETAVVTVVNELIDPLGKTVGRQSDKTTLAPGIKNTVNSIIKLTRPQLWSLEQPNLYQLKTTVVLNNRITDEAVTTTGFRSFTFDANKGFALNGEWMKMKGVCLHHDAGVLGAAVYSDVWRRRLLTLKEIGVNAIRTSHNPQSPELYRLCDELGLLVLNEAYDEWEFAKRKWLEGWNVGTPGYQGNFDYFAEWGERDLADMVKRDRNHVSVFAWSIGNEVDYPNDPYSHPVLGGHSTGSSGGFTQPIFGGYKKEAPDAMRLGVIAKKLAAVVKKYDNTRPVTAGLAGVAMSNETDYPGALDIAGYNYTENRYKQDHATYPDRIIYGSENRHEYAAWKSVTDNDFIFGQFLWTGIDYLGESGSWPSRGFYSGLLDFGGFIKPRGYFRKALWSTQPFIYAGTYPTPGKNNRIAGADVWSQMEAQNNTGSAEKTPSMDAWPVWNYDNGQLIRVVAYTNCPQAQLVLNNKPVGAIKNFDSTSGIIYWDIPYEPGKLEVKGLNGQQVAATNSIITSGRPYRLIASADKNPVAAKAGTIVHITITVVDEKGNKVMLADNNITCTVSGPAKLLGLEGSDNEDMGNYRDNRQRAYKGRLLAYIQHTGQPGDITVHFSSPLLQPVSLTLQ